MTTAQQQAPTKYLVTVHHEPEYGQITVVVEAIDVANAKVRAISLLQAMGATGPLQVAACEEA